MARVRIALGASAALLFAAPAHAQDAPAVTSQSAAPTAEAEAAATAETLTLPAGTPVTVVLSEDLSSETDGVGDRFKVTVLNDVISHGTIVIPQGTVGHGEVTFRTRHGGFGKPGMLGIALRTLDLNGKTVLLDGRYREEGKDRDGAAGATMFAVGIFAGFVKGKLSIIPQGRELRARTGEDIAFSPAEKAPAGAGPAPSPATSIESTPSESQAPQTGDPKPPAAGSQQPLSN